MVDRYRQADDMLAANSKVLEELTPRIDGFVDRDSQVMNA